MSNLLPQYINPWLLFRRNEVAQGIINLADMSGLQSLQHRQSGDVAVVLSVVERSDGKTVIRGNASVELELECQRCLEPLVEDFNAEFEFVLVKFEHQLGGVSEEDDAIVVEEQLELLPLIEQELILTLPMIAKHSDCQVGYENTNTVNGEVETQQPFAGLKDLLN